MSKYSLTLVSDGTLLRDLATLVARDRATTAELLAHIAEVDARRLYLPPGYPSMHAYCEQELRLSEDAANKRIRVARKAREIPALFIAIADGRLNLNAVVLLSSSLTPRNADELIGLASGKSRFEIERIVAERSPRSETMPMVVQWPSTEPEEVKSATEPARQPVVQLAARPVHVTSPRPKIAPIGRDRYDITFTIGQATHDKLRHAEALLSHAIPNGNLAAILDRVLDLAIERLEKKKFGAGSKHRVAKGTSKNPRQIPVQVRHAVWQRDGGQCTFTSESGHRCAERKKLEFDHADPVARGGQATVENIRLRCRAHNQYAAVQMFGAEFMRRKMARKGEESESGGTHARRDRG
jgi:hypothetical protein